jgi:CRISPR-associated endoribonuclease Cas6
MFDNYVYALVLQMVASGDLYLHPNIGRLVHAAFLNIVRELDAPLAQKLHDENQHKLYTTSPLWADTLRVKAGQDVYVRFTFLDPALAALFVEKFLLYGRSHTMQIDHIRLSITDVYATPNGHSRAGKLSLDSDESPLFNKVTLKFLTPTAFSRKNGKREEYLTDMQPQYVWKYARRMWGYAGGNDPRQDFDVWCQTYTQIESSELQLEQRHFQDFSVPGVSGQVSYCLEDSTHEEYHRLWCYLVRFMAFSSIGYKTTMGMGQVLPLIHEKVSPDGSS